MFRINLIIISLMTPLITQSVQANVSWTFNSGNCLPNCSGINSGVFGNTQDFGSATDSVTVSAFSTSQDLPAGTDNPSGNDAFETAQLQLWSGGLGIKSRDVDSGSPTHAIDNAGDTPSGDGGDVDGVVVSYGQDVSMTGVQIGWHGNNNQYDSDITVLAHDGVGDSSLVGKTFAQLLTNGWNFIGHYSNLVTNTTKTINADNVSSSKWLITAYTPEAGSPTVWSFGNDYFKLKKLIGDVTVPGPGPIPSVPEPSSILLLFAGWIGWRFSKNGWSSNDSSLKSLTA